MASMETMREYVSRQYSGTWPERVRKMPDYQVATIYHKMIDELDSVKKKPKNPKITETEVRGGLQLSFFEGRRGNKIKEEYLSERCDKTGR